MPTLTRYVSVLAVLAALVYGAMYALAIFVEPRKTEMSIEVKLDKLNTRATP